MDTEAGTKDPVEPTQPTPPPAQSAKTAWIVAAVATAVALVAVTVLITSAVVDDNRSRPPDGRFVRAARFTAPFGAPLAGEITSIDGRSFEIDDTRVTTDDETAFRASTKGELGDLETGDKVAVSGKSADGVVTATRIVEAPSMLRHNGPRAVHLRAPGRMRGGEITKIEGDTVTVDGPGDEAVTVKTTADTEIRVNKEIALRDLAVGDRVFVRGTQSEDGIDAKEVVKSD